MRKTGMMTGLALCLVGLTFAQVDVPMTFNYQGVLKHGDGSTVASPSQELEFRLFEVATGGAALWGRKIAVLLDADGLFNVELSDEGGSALPGLSALLPNVLAVKKNLYLELTVDGSAILPRQKLLSVPFAMRAGDVQQAANDFTVEGVLTVRSGAEVHSLTVTEDAEVQGNLHVGGTTIFSDAVDISGHANLSPNSSHLRLASGYDSPVSGRIFIGDGTGWKTHLSRTELHDGGIVQDLVTFHDNGNVEIGGNLKVNGSNLLHSPIAGLRVTVAHIAADGTCTSPDPGVSVKKIATGEYEVSFPEYDTFPFVSVTTSMDEGSWDSDARNNYAVSDYLLKNEVEIDTRDPSGFLEDTPFDIIIIGVDTTP